MKGGVDGEGKRLVRTQPLEQCSQHASSNLGTHLMHTPVCDFVSVHPVSRDRDVPARSH